MELRRRDFLQVAGTAAALPHSKYCKFEFEQFLSREGALARDDLVFPILFVPVAGLLNEDQWRDHDVLSVVGKRQYVDWQTFRHSDVHTPAMREQIANFAGKIVEALHRSWTPPASEEKSERAIAERPAEEVPRPHAVAMERPAQAPVRARMDIGQPPSPIDEKTAVAAPRPVDASGAGD